jgi:trimethylamine--corrinoid protein Co-methyltransferase
MNHLSPLRIVSEDFIEDVISEAFDILMKVGVFIENQEAYALLCAHGAKPTDGSKNGGVGKLLFPQDMIEKALETAPQSIQLGDVRGDMLVALQEDQVHYDPGSAALYLHDPAAGRIRRPMTKDLLRYIRLVDRLPHYHLQSSALISADVPESCADSYRLYLALRYGRKPIVTGTFHKSSFRRMQEMLTLVRSGAQALRELPLSIFDACPSPPLMWSDLTSQSVLDAARAGIPSEFVSMPLTGSTAPVTLAGAVVQHTAETLSGVVLAQSAMAGSPVIWGGSPSAMDLRYGTTPMGAVETMMLNLADVAVGKYLDLPTHAYMGLSDAKQVDYQAGMESALGIFLAGLAGINVVSGAGMLDFENCQSLEKLYLDHEVCAMAYRFLEGIVRRDEVMALDLLAALPQGGHFLTHPHTLRWFKEEIISPGKAIDRRARNSEVLCELSSAAERAHTEVERLLSGDDHPYLDEKVLIELDRMMTTELKRCGAEGLPK